MGVRTKEEIIQLVKKYMVEGVEIKEKIVFAIDKVVSYLKNDEEVLCAFTSDKVKFNKIEIGAVLAFTNRRMLISRISSTIQDVEVYEFDIYTLGCVSLRDKFWGLASFDIKLHSDKIDISLFPEKEVDNLFNDLRTFMVELGIEHNMPVSDKAKEIVRWLIKSKNNNEIAWEYYYSAEEIAKVLKSDEHIINAFDGFNIKVNEDFIIVAVTNRRVYIGMRVPRLIGKNYYTVEMLNIDRCCDVELIHKITAGYLIVIYDEQRKKYYKTSLLPREHAQYIYNSLRDAIEEAKKFVPQAIVPQVTPVQSETVADEIKKFKELLDMGAITQEEFDAKKKQLLGM